MKFKVGDKVKVKDNSKFNAGKYAGKLGAVKEVERGVPFPYYILLDGTSSDMPFLANELEKVE